jgi:hypothetical protein
VWDRVSDPVIERSSIALVGGGRNARLPLCFESGMLGSIAELVHNAHRGHEAVKATLEAINQMQADGVIGKYAIGGAVGATFYLEPAATLDVDIFVVLPMASGGSLP